MKVLVLFLVIFASAILALPFQERSPEERGGNFEGDMELDDVQISSVFDLNQDRNGLINERYRWLDNKIFYEIDDVFDEEHVNHILKGIKMIESVSCLRFYPRTSENEDYIHVTGANTGCHSMVGRRGGKQTLNLQIYPLDTGCFRIGTVAHEFLHALGFHHQQSAANRDDYVTIVPTNIESSALHNFLKYFATVVTDFGFPYDYGSVMHYSATSFTKNGEKTIITKDPNAAIGQRERLSLIDINKLNTMYGCKEI